MGGFLSKLEDRQAAAATTAAAAGEGGGRLRWRPRPEGRSRGWPSGWALPGRTSPRPPEPAWLSLASQPGAPLLTDPASRANASSVTSQPCPSPQPDVTPSPLTVRFLGVLVTWPTAERRRHSAEPARPPVFQGNSGTCRELQGVGDRFSHRPQPNVAFPLSCQVAALVRLSGSASRTPTLDRTLIPISFSS